MKLKLPKMKSMRMPKALQPAAQCLQKNAPTILTCIGVAGYLGTIAEVGRMTPKAVRLRDAAERKKGEPLTNVEIIQSCWRCYSRAFILAAVSTACVLGANSIHLRRNAGLMAAYALSEANLRDYKEKAKEIFGEEKAQEVQEKVYEKKLNEQAGLREVSVQPTGNGTQLCYDLMSGRYFYSSIDKLRSAENELNVLMNEDGHASLNDWYSFVNLGEIEIGYNLGWSMQDGGLMRLDLSSQLAAEFNQTPCVVVGFKHGPVFNYDTLY